MPWWHHKCSVQDSASISLLFTCFQLYLGWRKILKAITWRCHQKNATNVTMHSLRKAIWGHTWKRTVGKIQTTATSVIIRAWWFRKISWKVPAFWNMAAVTVIRMLDYIRMPLCTALTCRCCNLGVENSKQFLKTPHPPKQVLKSSTWLIDKLNEQR